MILESSQQNQQASQSNELEEEILEDEIEKEILYKNWRKNAPYLYNTIITQSVVWPSLTAQWFPDKMIRSQGYSINKILYGTNTSNEQQDYLIVSKVKLTQQTTQNGNKQQAQNENDNQIYLINDLKQPKIQVYSMIQHEGQVNRARYNPSNPTLIASKSSNSNIYVFNYNHYSKDAKQESANTLKLCLVGHNDQGFGLSWSQTNPGIVISGSNDGKVLSWDINKLEKGKQNGSTFENSFVGHTSSVNDVSCHKTWANIFGSCDDLGNVFFWDFRQKSQYKRSNKHHEGQIYSIDFSRTNQYLYTSGGSDQLVCVWDLRMKDVLFKLQGHNKQITKVEISPMDKNIIWSSSNDNTLRMWDLGSEQKLRFIHGGHRGAVSDFSIHSKDENKLFSVDQNNQIQIFDPIY